MMTHANVLAVTSAVMTIVPGIGTKDIYMAYLPLAHILELAAEVWIICKLAGLHGHCNSMSSLFFSVYLMVMPCSVVPIKTLIIVFKFICSCCLV